VTLLPFACPMMALYRAQGLLGWMGAEVAVAMLAVLY